MNSLAGVSSLSTTMSSDGPSEAEQHAVMTEMEDKYRIRAHMFRQVEFYWRRRSFAVTMMMGLLPIMAPMGNLMPSFLTPWYSLLISIANVTVVVVSIKCDMSDRVSDATMASKGYERVMQKLQNIKVEQTLSPETVMITKLFDEIKILVETIEGNITYPEKVTMPEVHPEVHHDTFIEKPHATSLPASKDLNEAKGRTANLKDIQEAQEALDANLAQEAEYIKEIAGYKKDEDQKQINGSGNKAEMEKALATKRQLRVEAQANLNKTQLSIKDGNARIEMLSQQKAHAQEAADIRIKVDDETTL